MIEILEAPPYCSVQDLGRYGFRDQGVPPSGAMDPESLSLANLMAGNPIGAAGLEWALGRGRLRFARPCRVAITGANATLLLDGSSVPSWTAFRVGGGTEVELDLPRDGRFAYFAVEGGIDVPVVLGSRSTYLPGKFGGLDGRLVRKGDVISCSSTSHSSPGFEPATLPETLRPARDGSIRVLEGPQRPLFIREMWEQLRSENYTVSPTSDRMGYRLDGPSLAHAGDAAMPSEPVCPGAVQVPLGSPPIVLMPDGPTVGGYPKIAVIATADLGAMAQLPPGARLRFVPVQPDAAVAALLASRGRLDQAKAWISRLGQ